MTFKKVFRGFDPKEVENYIIQRENADKQVFQAQKQRIAQLENQNAVLKFETEKLKKEAGDISATLVESQKIAQKIGDPQKLSDLVLARAKIFYATWITYAKVMESSLNIAQQIEFDKLKDRLEQLLSAYEGKNIDEQFSILAEKLSAEILFDRDETEQERRKNEESGDVDSNDDKTDKQYHLSNTNAVDDLTENADGFKKTFEQSSNAVKHGSKAQERYFNAYLGIDVNNEDGSEFDSEEKEKEELSNIDSLAGDSVNANKNTDLSIKSSDSDTENCGQVQHAIDLRELIKPTESLEELCKDLGLVEGKEELKLEIDATIGEEDK